MSEFACNCCFEDICATLWAKMRSEKYEEWAKSLSTCKDKVACCLFNEWVFTFDMSSEKRLYLGKASREIGSKVRIQSFNR